MNNMLVAGVDEAGRGPLAGPVVTAAVILDPELPIEGLRDSKKLTEKRRQLLADEIREKSLAWAMGRAECTEIDDLNILQASLMAMSRAVAALSIAPQQVLVDGNMLPQLEYPARAIIGGDDTVPAISAASILAKVARDQEMIALDRSYPEYGFARHKGYPTAQHMQALQAHGPCAVHRLSFGPCKQAQLAV